MSVDARDAFALAPTLDARFAADMCAALAARAGQATILDAERVEFLGGAAFQVMLAARKSCAAAGAPFLICNPSPSFADQWRALAGPDDVFQSFTGDA